ncbi:pilus assembly protein [Siculibacillus lacustris]|uniref:Pilus assembly protein n=1 Tax=Siculibacillus lacustris TaxID=1549641 RepID=A0A4Q9VTG0_9HYPH|nr:TadE/TadG family type IV pilus assembly protein [Siculibacillus lacustris]TBW39230.1 pilus assembly protein [Siculibacillus lacustris]
MVTAPLPAPATPVRASLVARGRAALRRLVADRRGVSAVEFAILLPLMLTLFIAGNEVSQAMTIYRKISHTGATLGDLVSQVSSISSSDMTNILAAANAVMAPYDASQAKLVVSAVNYTTSGGFVTAWSVASNTTAWTVGSTPPITIPSGLVTNGQQLIVTQARYDYVSTFSTFMADIWGSGTITLKDVTYLRPRVSTTVAYPSPN